MVCEKSLYRYFKKLKDKEFLAVFYYARRTYYSTYLNQKRLKQAVMKRVLERDKKKLENNDAVFRERINEERKKLKLKRMGKYF